MPNGKVLLIEDDEDIRSALHVALESEGYGVVTAMNGREGLDALEQTKEISVVLLDLRMPVMNGEEFINVVRDKEDLNRIPVIVVSANADRGCNLKGVASVIHKPFDLDHLFDSIRQYCV